MKLRLRVSNCAFSVPIKRGRIPEARVVQGQCEGGARQSTARRFLPVRPKRRARIDAPYLRAFTLIELLTVIAIVGILAALIAPVFKHFSKSDVTEAATRQMLDDCARARQLAISQRSTVYMVFIPTNFWANPALNRSAWSALPPTFQQSTTITQMYGAQWNGYMIESLRSVGDQPGRSIPKDLVKVRTLPDGSFISPIKFTLPTFYTVQSLGQPTLLISNYTIYGFLTASNIPFPTADIITNSTYYNNQFLVNYGFYLPYIAFNYLGQLTPGDGTVLPYDEFIPLAYGSTLPSRAPNSKNYVQGFPNFTEGLPGSSTNISYNLIHIDRITGRARVERQDVL